MSTAVRSGRADVVATACVKPGKTLVAPILVEPKRGWLIYVAK